MYSLYANSKNSGYAKTVFVAEKSGEMMQIFHFMEQHDTLLEL